jgi:hypothetical protein
LVLVNKFEDGMDPEDPKTFNLSANNHLKKFKIEVLTNGYIDPDELDPLNKIW